jgi:hypothetical protein
MGGGRGDKAATSGFSGIMTLTLSWEHPARRPRPAAWQERCRFTSVPHFRAVWHEAMPLLDTTDSRMSSFG